MADTPPQYHRIDRKFVRHYVEMVAVMFAGMALLWMPATLVVNTDGDAAMLATMAATMTVPMVAWMRVRGHRWQPTLEMAAAMIVPTLAALALLTVKVDAGLLMGLEHIAMLGGMLMAMLARRDEYSHHHEVAA